MALVTTRLKDIMEYKHVFFFLNSLQVVKLCRMKQTMGHDAACFLHFTYCESLHVKGIKQVQVEQELMG